MHADNVPGRLLLAHRSLFVQAASPGRSRYIPTLFECVCDEGRKEVLTPSPAPPQLVSAADRVLATPVATSVSLTGLDSSKQQGYESNLKIKKIKGQTETTCVSGSEL